MSQLTFKFPFKTKYYEEDYYVSSNNFSVYRLIENWPNWPGKWVNIHGPSGSGKTHLSNILKKKINLVKIIDAKNINDQFLLKFEKLDCLIIDNYAQNINEALFYTLLNQSKQLDIFILINSTKPIKDSKYELEDLKSRAESFINLGIELPTDDLLRVIISKFFSDKQIEITPKISDYIIKNIDRSYEKVFKFIKEIDDLSLSSGKSININLIKKVLKDE
ncbi:DNA replication protein [Candidatus Pelagibacter bacterium]|nr:DNA replication protein [Candidatus Pelagibacter bacterium]MDA9624875.1 DNA replication protein [Candidatus Pelagibacter bacterium]